MFLEQFAAAIERSPVREFDRLSNLIWQGLAAGAIDAGAAQALADALQRRREAARSGQSEKALQGALRAPLAIPRPKPQRSPDKARSIARRRSLAASGPLPPRLAANFTTGELAALRIIADEVGSRGNCDRSIGEIAARAGVGMSTVRNAVRFAARCGLLTVQERPRPGRKNLTNIVRVISAEWLAWLAIGRRKQNLSESALPLFKGIGFKKPESTDTDTYSFRDRTGVWRPKGLPQGREKGAATPRRGLAM